MFLHPVRIVPRPLRLYASTTPPAILREIRKLAPALRGARIAHVNTTPRGGGVAEMLRTSMGILRSLGVTAEWYVVEADPQFFEITKSIHNFLQGKSGRFSQRNRDHYLHWNERFARDMERIAPDLWLVHDPQPAASIMFLAPHPPMTLRVHIDTSHPNRSVLRFFDPIFRSYDRVIFTLSQFAPPKFPKAKSVFFTPVIDQTNDANRPMGEKEAKRILKRLGLNPARPLLTQVSRLDPWKDPLGVLEAFRLARGKIPGLQFLYEGVVLAKDDPEAFRIAKAMRRAIKGERDAHLLWHPRQLRGISLDRVVNALQTASDVILQKSLREGFGMTVTEAMWKRTPVVGGNVGGIRLQIKNGYNGFLVNSVHEAAKRTTELFENPKLRRLFGKRGREHVRRNFLMPRLIRDELRLYRELLHPQ